MRIDFKTYFNTETPLACLGCPSGLHTAVICSSYSINAFQCKCIHAKLVNIAVLKPESLEETCLQGWLLASLWNLALKTFPN